VLHFKAHGVPVKLLKIECGVKPALYNLLRAPSPVTGCGVSDLVPKSKRRHAELHFKGP
jgi:hypothetical protein